MNESHTYQVNLKWLENRKGILDSAAVSSTIEVVTPPEFPKGISGIWSPEHLFVAALNGCFMTTFLAIAENSKLAFESFECNSVGTLEKIQDRYSITKIKLLPKVTLSDSNMQEKAVRVLAMAEKACLISNSIRSEVALIPEVLVLNKLK